MTEEDQGGTGGRLSLARCRELVGDAKITDDELLKLRDDIYDFALDVVDGFERGARAPAEPNQEQRPVPGRDNQPTLRTRRRGGPGERKRR
jgi:hypothetical protein